MIPNNPTCPKEWMAKLENPPTKTLTFTSSQNDLKVGHYINMPPKITRRHKFILWLAKLMKIKVKIMDDEFIITAVNQSTASLEKYE